MKLVSASTKIDDAVDDAGKVVDAVDTAAKTDVARMVPKFRMDCVPVGPVALMALVPLVEINP